MCRGAGLYQVPDLYLYLLVVVVLHKKRKHMTYLSRSVCGGSSQAAVSADSSGSSAATAGQSLHVRVLVAQGTSQHCRRVCLFTIVSVAIANLHAMLAYLRCTTRRDMLKKEVWTPNGGGSRVSKWGDEASKAPSRVGCGLPTGMGLGSPPQKKTGEFWCKLGAFCTVHLKVV